MGGKRQTEKKDRDSEPQKRRVRKKIEETSPHRDSGQSKRELYDNITTMDMNTNMMMNCVVRFKSKSVVLSLMFTS